MVTLKDIAEKCNVSVTTVSRVVNYNDTSICSEETQKLIWSLVESMNYKVRNKRNNAAGQAPDQSQAIKLAYVLGSSSYVTQGSYSYHIIKGIESEAVKQGASIGFNIMNLDLYKPAELCERFEEVGVKSIIWLAGTDEEYFEMLQRKNIQVTIAGIEPGFMPDNADYVGVDFYPETLRWLKTKFVNRFERTAYIGPTFSSRYEAFVDAHRIAGKEIDPELVIHQEDWEIETAKESIARFLEKGVALPEAMFAASDLIAIGAMNALKENGIEVPDQVRMLGFDDSPMASFVTPGLTTIGVPTYEIGVVAVQAAISKLKEKRDFPISYVLRSRFVERQSL